VLAARGALIGEVREDGAAQAAAFADEQQDLIGPRKR